MPLQKQCYRPESLRWYERFPASPAVRVGDLLFIAGQVSLDADFETIAQGDVKAQVRNAFKHILEILEMAGGNVDDIVDIISFHKDLREMDSVFDVAREFLKKDYPAWTAVGTVGSYRNDLLVSIRVIAHLGKEKKNCFTPDSLKWWRSYPISGGCQKGNLLFISGQVAADADGHVTTPGDHAAQARYAFNRIQEIVRMAGGTMDDVIDILSFHHDVRGMDPAFGVVCSPETFGNIPFESAPAWTAIATQGLYKLGMLGSYRVIADLSPGKRIAKTPASIWWKTLPISGGTRKDSGSLIGISGEVASDGDGNIVSPGDTASQARYAFDRIKETLEMFGASMDNVVEVTSFHKDPRAWEIVMKVGEEYFRKGQEPAWTPVGMTGLYKEGYLHEIYALAVI